MVETTENIPTEALSDRKQAILDKLPHFLSKSAELSCMPEEIKSDKSMPAAEYEIEHVYGYTNTCSNNLHYTEAGEIVFQAAALGVVMETENGRQRVYGGKQVDMGPKTSGEHNTQHRDDIKSLCISADRKLVATGQVGHIPNVQIWNPETCENVAYFELPAGSKGVECLSLSPCGRYVAVVDAQTNHFVTIFNVQRNKTLLHMSGGVDDVKNIAWSKRPNDLRFATQSTKTIKFWHAADVTKRLVIPGKLEKAPAVKFASIDFDAEGWMYSGGSGGHVYVWSDTCQVVKQIKVSTEMITTVACASGKVLVGCKDKKVAIISAAGGNFSLDKFVNLGESFPKALDFHNGNLIAGMRNGTILEFKNVMEGAEDQQPQALMQSHYDGEVWGLDMIDGGKQILTSGDDNRIMLINTEKLIVERTGKVEGPEGSDFKHCEKSTASSMGIFSADKQSRSIACSKKHSHVVNSNNYGEITVRDFADFEKTITILKGPKEWCEAMRYSPCEKYLAAGSHDQTLYIWEISEEGEYSLHSSCKKHSSGITSLDWTTDSTKIQTNDCAHEKLYYNVEEKKYDSRGPVETEWEWATMTSRLSWNTQGVYPAGQDGTHINAVWEQDNLLASADDWGLINVFNAPCLDNSHQARSYAGHSAFVTRICANADGSKLFSLGGNDQTIIQWRRK